MIHDRLCIREVGLLQRERIKQRRRKDPILAKEEKPGLRSSASRIIEGSVNQYTTPGRAERYAGRLAGFRSIMPGIRDIIKATFQFNSDILKDIIKGPTHHSATRPLIARGGIPKGYSPGG